MEVADSQAKIDLVLGEKDLECLESACLLHNIGLCTGKKGYHKQTYQLIMNGDRLPGYSTEEVKLIALLARHHKKKFPKSDHSTLYEISEEVLREASIRADLSGRVEMEKELRKELVELKTVFQQTIVG